MSFPPMDVRCEKCQTEYELDESRLKPGGVTVKCTNCGHMFKIRKRTPTNVGAPAVGTTPGFGKPAAAPRADSLFEGQEGPTTVERQWVIRLESGEQKTCRELATLQQWIVSNVVTRESLISRTGKTWKRLGDISELAQYFEIADEARKTRGEKETKPVKGAAGTMLGMGSAPAAAGGTILPDDPDEGRSTGSYRTQGTKRPTTQPPPVPARTPPMGSNVTQAGAGPSPAASSAGSGPIRQPLTTPPGPPPKKTPTGPVPHVPEARPAQPTPAPPKPTPAPPVGSDARSTAAWASDPIKATGIAPSGPYHGKLSAIPDEPAFAGPGGRVRVQPSDESSFETGKVGLVDDDEMMSTRRGSKAGLIVLLMMLLVGAGAAAIVYVFVIKKDAKKDPVAVVADAAVPAVDAQSLVVTPMVDAAEAPPPLSPVEVATGELATDNETRLRASLESLPKDAPETQAVRANLGAAIAQALIDRAGLVADKSEAEKLRKESKAIVLEAATAAQRAVKATPDDPAANVAMAHVLRLQGKSLRDMQRYLDAAKAKPGTWKRDVDLAEAMVPARDGKLDDARKMFEAIDSGDGKLETSNDVRARFHRALIALAQNKAADAKPLVDQILAAQPEHAGAKALAAKLETKVSSTDPLPPEEPGKGSASKPNPNPNPNPNPDVSTGGSYDQLVARANKLAETNCSKAMELYAKALEQKPNGVEALAGQGFCHIDAKQFASAHSKFRSALAISSKFEPALWGIAEAYQQQGRREQAIEAYKAYLEVYPNTAKAQKQIDRLSGTPGGGSGSATPPTPPTPPAGDGSAQPQKPDAPKDPTPEGGGSGTQ